MELPNFDPNRAKEYVMGYEDFLVRDFVKLLFLRDIEGLAINDTIFLRLQEKLLPNLNIGLSTWIEKNKQRTFISFQEVLSFFGYLGLNGTKIPQLVDAVDFTFTRYPRRDGAFIATSGKVNKCPNASFLRAVLALGFTDDLRVKQACMEFLNFIKGREGDCHVRTDGNPCAYVLVKMLRWLNEYPPSWRDKNYQEVVTNIQDYLLTHNLSEADYPRRKPEPNKNWFKFGYFRSYQASVFEAAEALVLSGVKQHPVLQNTLDVIGAQCLDGVTWKPQYIQRHWPLQLEYKQRGKKGSPWLTLRGLRIANALEA